MSESEQREIETMALMLYPVDMVFTNMGARVIRYDKNEADRKAWIAGAIAMAEKKNAEIKTLSERFYSSNRTISVLEKELEAVQEELEKLKKEIGNGVLTDEEIQKEAERLYPDQLGKQVAFCEGLLSIKARIEHKIKVGLLENKDALLVWDGVNETRKIRIAITESGPIVIYIEGERYEVRELNRGGSPKPFGL